MSQFYDDTVLNGIPILRADRSPCPVCNHPTGDCVSSHTATKPPHIAFTDSVIETLKNSQMILVEENVYEERQITPFTKVNVIAAHKGSYVTLERAKELGIS
jgi:hypothetical protein